MVTLGVALGLSGAFALTRVMKSLLFDVSARDPLTFACVALLLSLVALAGLLSACAPRRANRIRWRRSGASEVRSSAFRRLRIEEMCYEFTRDLLH